MHSSTPPQIPGYQIPHHEAQSLKRTVADLLERDNERFPGAQPVSFAREHIAELQHTEYFMCEKTDGIRCLLYLNYADNGATFEPVTFLIDRKNNYYEINPPLRIPYFQDPNDRNKFMFGTILDGELVHDHYPNEPKPRLVYYAFDCLAVDNTNVTMRPLDIRLGKLRAMVFTPYQKLLSSGHSPPQPFGLKEKQNFPSYHITNIFTHILPNLRHGNDGLIFTCKNTRYEFGTDNHILKWKPPHENTIDFKLKLGEFPTFDPDDGEGGEIPDYDAMPISFQLLVLVGNGKYEVFAQPLTVTEEEWEILKSLNQRLDGRIIECFRDTNGKWRYKREDDGSPRWRDDKKDANHISTVNSVLASIEDPVTEQDLRSVEGRIKDAVIRLRREEEKHRKLGPESEAKKRKFSEANLNGVQ